MKILVVGGAGFIGSHVAEFYARRDYEITVLDNLSRSKTLKVKNNSFYNWNYLKVNYPKIKLYRGDIRKSKTLKTAAKGAYVILHVAGQVAVTKSVEDPRTDFEINALGTFNVLESARLNDSAIIYTSTNKVYGENVNKIPIEDKGSRYAFTDERFQKGIPETFPIDHCKHSPYGCSKLAGDIYTQDYAHTYGLKIGVFRMSCIYGQRQFGVEDQGWLSWFIIATVTGKPIMIYGDGKQVRDVLYISDLLQAFDAFIQRKNQLSGEVFNIGGGPENTLSLLELLDLLKQLTGKRSKINFSSWRPSDQEVYISDITKAKEKLGWTPKINSNEGVRRLVNWVSENKQLFE